MAAIDSARAKRILSEQGIKMPWDKGYAEWEQGRAAERNKSADAVIEREENNLKDLADDIRNRGKKTKEGGDK